MRRFRSRFCMALTNVDVACCTLSCSIMTDLFTTREAKRRVNFGRLVAPRSKSLSHLTSRLCCDRSKQALATDYVPTLQFATRAPGRVNLQTVSFISNMFICMRQSQVVEPTGLGPVRETCRSWEDVGRWTSDLPIHDNSNISRRTRSRKFVRP